MKFLNKIVLCILILILSISSTSCQTKNDTKMEFKIIDFNKIPGETPWNDSFDALNKYEFNQILNYNKDIFFLLGGSRISYKTPNDKTSSVIYRSLDFGATFNKITLGTGTISEGCFAGKNMFVVLENQDFIDGASRVSSSLFISKDFGETWGKIKDFDESMSRINFYNDKTGIAYFYDDIKDIEKYRYTVDGGETWIEFKIDNKDFDSISNCLFRTNNTIWFISTNNLMSYNLASKELKIEKKLPVPHGMKADTIYRDEKTRNPITFFGYDDNDDKGEIYYILEDKHVTIENGFGNVYGSLMYKFIDNKPYSSYMWSEDLGKTWQTEKMEDFFPDPRPIGYAEGGYIYMLVAMIKGGEEERGARLVIGHPVIKK